MVEAIVEGVEVVDRDSLRLQDEVDRLKCRSCAMLVRARGRRGIGRNIGVSGIRRAHTRARGETSMFEVEREEKGGTS